MRSCATAAQHGVRHMKNFFAGFLAASILSVVFFTIFAAPRLRDSYREVGLDDGRILAKHEVAESVRRLLGTDVNGGEESSLFFSVKAIQVRVVMRNGVKTLRVVE